MSALGLVMAASLLFAFVDAHYLRAEDSTQIGVELANIVKATGGQLATGGDATGFEKSLFADMVSKQDVLVNPAVSHAIAQANRAAASKTMANDICETNWGAECPDGWAAVGGTCQAPKAYSGCATQQAAFTNTVGKMKFSKTCLAPWPCMDACAAGHEYDACPAGFSSLDGGFCSAPDKTQCGQSTFNFAAMPIADRIELGVVCGFSWPCRAGTCEQNLTAACPTGWGNMSGLCIAPASYAGPCPYSIDTAGMAAGQKSAFATKCAVSFPCVD